MRRIVSEFEIRLQLFGGGGSKSGLGGGGGKGGSEKPQNYTFILIRPEGKPQVWRTKAKSKEEANKKADKYVEEEGFKEKHSNPYTDEEWKQRNEKTKNKSGKK